MSKRLNFVLAPALLALLVACGQQDDPNAPGSLSGTIQRAVAEAPEEMSTASIRPADIVPGSLFISFGRNLDATTLGSQSSFAQQAAAAGFSFAQDGSFSFSGKDFELQRSYPGGTGLGLYRIDGLSVAETKDLRDRLSANGFVSTVFPNIIMQAHAVPDDTYYEVQAWHYEQLNLPAAWDIEDGSTNPVNIAVIDTGSFPHSDIAWQEGVNLVGFYSTDPADKDGLPFDDPTSTGSDHGTHVAGTIGALSNNGAGVAGVNQSGTPITPIKVLNAAGSGSFDDILEGLFWAAGLDNEDYPDGWTNPNPAQVINMSLGGNLQEACPSEIDVLFQVINAVSGAITVVSAGNDASPTDGYFPANCPSVITVGATGPDGARAYYSNFGPQVDVMAPGGNFDLEHPDPDFAELGFPAGVLSTVYDVASGTEDYGFYQGTSMAAPHISGVVSLLLSQEPELSIEEVRERLQDASRPLTMAQCSSLTSGQDGLNMCGAGLVDAVAVLNAEVAADATAVAYAVRYDGDTAPEIRLGDLGSLDNLTADRAEAELQEDGSYTFSFDALAPGNYVIVGIEQRLAGEGVGSYDRFGTAEVTIEAGAEATADIEVDLVSLLVN